MMTSELLDLRGLPVWDRAERVLEHSDLLATGDSFEFVTEIDPRALLSRLEQLRSGRLAFAQRHIGENEWHVTLTHVQTEEGVLSLDAALRRSPAFSKLNPSVRSQMKESSTLHTARKGHTILAENAPCSELGIVLDGAVAVFAGAGSRERLLFHLFPFDVFGDIEFFDGGLSIGRTVVLSKSARYATIPYTFLRELATRDSALLTSLATGVSQHNRTLAGSLTSQVSQPILSRVAGALLPYAAPERGLHPALTPLPTMTQAQVAAAAGTVKEVAARAIAELERVQALRRERGHIRYLDRATLLETIDQA